LAGLTLDAGVLIAAERDDRQFWAFWRLAMEHKLVPVVPAAALAQAWRGPPSARLAQLLEACEIEPLDEALAKGAGELCARSRIRDIIDASVVVTARRRGSDILTTDTEDLTKLVSVRSRTCIIDMRKATTR